MPVHRQPVLAAVHRLPAEVPGADVHRVRIHRIERDRLEISQVRVIRRRDAGPGLAAVDRAEHAGDGAHGEDLRAGGRNCQRADGFALDALEDREGVAAVRAARDPAAVATDFPVADEDHAARIDRDLVEALPALREAGAEALPMFARVLRAVENAVRRPQVDVPRVARVRRESAYVAARRADRDPRLRAGESRPGQREERCYKDVCELPRRRCHGPLGSVRVKCRFAKDFRVSGEHLRCAPAANCAPGMSKRRARARGCRRTAASLAGAGRALGAWSRRSLGVLRPLARLFIELEHLGT